MTEVKRYVAGSLYEEPRPGGIPVVMASDYDQLKAQYEAVCREMEQFTVLRTAEIRLLREQYSEMQTENQKLKEEIEQLKNESKTSPDKTRGS